jgi:hypothetical protein
VCRQSYPSWLRAQLRDHNKHKSMLFSIAFRLSDTLTTNTRLLLFRWHGGFWSRSGWVIFFFSSINDLVCD